MTTTSQLRRAYLLVVLALLTALPASAQRLPVNPAVTVGTLDNGLTYYIRENDEPRRRAFLRLAVDAGSVLEDDDQLGLAHFLEHMAFNGTENYSGNDIITFLETLGMQFGPDINAYTGFDQTVYQLTVPTDEPETFQQAFTVLLEWAERMTLDESDIDGERGVITEEWRSRRNAAQRVADEQYPVLFADSPYANRLPIGDMDIVASFEPHVLRRFYEDWYRPDLMAVIAVGDFDTLEVEALITELFSEMHPPANPRPRPEFTVPEQDGTRVVVSSDPETPNADVSVVTMRPADELTTRDDYRDLLTGLLFASMLNNRLDEISRRPNAPFLGAAASSGGFVRTAAAATLSATAQGNEVAPALEALLVEARRVVEHGFTETELGRAKARRMRAIEQMFRERDNVHSAPLSDEYVRAYLQGEAIPGIAFERHLHEELLPEITLEAVNAVASAYLSEDNRVVLVSTIESDELPTVTEQDVRRSLQLAQGIPVEPYEDRVVSNELVPGLPPRGWVVSETPLDDHDVVSWELSNGVRVVYKATDLRDDQVLFTAFSPGGSSVAPADAFRSAQYATVFVENMGYGAFSPPDLERALAGRAVSVTPYIGSEEEGLSGGASAEDLDLLFELIHLKMTVPRPDPVAFDVLRRQFHAVIANQEAQPQFQFSRLLRDRFNLGHARTMPIDARGIESITMDRVLASYRDRLADAGDFTFVFVGNLDPERFRDNVERYLASLPSSGRDDRWRDLEIDHPTRTVVDSVRAGLEPVSQVAVLMHGDYRFNQANNFAIRTVERAMEIRMQEVLREEESGTYGVGVQAAFSSVPEDEYQFTITFRADPDRVDALTERLFAVVDELRTTELDEVYIQRIRETLRSGFEENLTSNQFWLGQIVYALKHERPMSAIMRYLDLVNAVTPRSITDAARRYLPEDRYVQITLYPEGAE